MFSGGVGDCFCFGGGIKIRLSMINCSFSICNSVVGGLCICFGFCY